MAKSAGGDAVRGACRTCFYWRIGLLVVAAALLATWLVQGLGG
jgi:hypothetical protein